MGEYKVWVDHEGYIRAKIVGEHDKGNAENIINELNELIKRNQRKGKILIDMTETGRPTSQARKLHATNMKQLSKNIKKAALYGASAMNRVMANFIIKASGMGDIVKYFNTEEQAILWLKK